MIDSYTKLLLHCNRINGSTTFADSSPNGRAVTASGSAKVMSSKFNDSAFFNGSAKVTAPASTDWAFGTGNFTIDCWIYLASDMDTNERIIVSNYTGAASTTWILEIVGRYLQFFAAGGSCWITGGTYLSLETWYHVAAVKEGTGTDQTKIYLNGILEGTSSFNYNFSDSAQLTVGATSEGTARFYHKGWIDELRISKGLARWTGNFTPPTSPYTSDGNTQVLLHLDNNVTDSGNTGHTFTNSGVTFTPAQKFGTGLLKLNAAGGTISDYVYCADSADFAMLTGDFTIDFWVYPVSIGLWDIFFGQGDTGNNVLWCGIWDSSGGQGLINFGSYLGGGQFDFLYQTDGYPLVAGAWQHIAFVRASDYWQIYHNGTAQLATPYYRTNSYSDKPGNFTVGNCVADPGYTQAFHGYIDEFRVSKGIARWTSNFVPPVAPYYRSFAKCLAIA